MKKKETSLSCLKLLGSTFNTWSKIQNLPQAHKVLCGLAHACRLHLLSTTLAVTQQTPLRAGAQAVALSYFMTMSLSKFLVWMLVHISLYKVFSEKAILGIM